MASKIKFEDLLKGTKHSVEEFLKRTDSKLFVAFIYGNIFLYVLGISLFFVLKFIKAL